MIYWLKQKWWRFKKSRRMKQEIKELYKIAGRLLLIGLLLQACVTTRFSEEVIDADGSSSTTQYSANAIVPPFSKLEPSNHNFHYVWGENSIAVGQQAEGIDSRAQVQALGVALESLLALAPILAPLFQTPPLEGSEP